MVHSPSFHPRSVALAFLVCTSSCQFGQVQQEQLPQAEFGLFFGGQIQQRTEIPFELDSTRQTLGFHLAFSAPVSQPTAVQWIINYPTARRGSRGRSNAPRSERHEQATLAVGADRFEQRILLRPSDVPGTYNIRVLVNSTVVLDRPFLVSSTQHDVDD